MGSYDVGIDYYVPFSISYKPNDFEDMVCWRIGDLNKSLMEFSIGKKSNILKAVTLVAVSNAYLTDDKLNMCNNQKTGVPLIFMNELMEKDVYDFPLKFDTFLGNNYMLVKFGRETSVCYEVVTGRVIFRFNNNDELISVLITKLSDDEYGELKDGLKL